MEINNETKFICCTSCGLIINKENSYVSAEGKLICADCNEKQLTNN